MPSSFKYPQGLTGVTLLSFRYPGQFEDGKDKRDPITHLPYIIHDATAMEAGTDPSCRLIFREQ